MLKALETFAQHKYEYENKWECSVTEEKWMP